MWPGMETAPGTGSPVTMPDPERVVTRSLGTLKALHHSETEALVIITGCATSAVMALQYAGITDTAWLDQIVATANRRLRVLHTPRSTTEGQCSGDTAPASTGPAGPGSGAATA